MDLQQVAWHSVAYGAKVPAYTTFRFLDAMNNLTRQPLAAALMLALVLPAASVAAAPPGVPCPSIPRPADPGDPAVEVSYLCGVEIAAHDLWFDRSLEVYDATVIGSRDRWPGVEMDINQRGYLVMEDSLVETAGTMSDALVMTSNHVDGARISRSHLRTSGEASTGLYVGNISPDASGFIAKANTTTVIDSSIFTQGQDSAGVALNPSAWLQLRNVDIATQGDRAFGLWNYRSDVAMQGGSIRTAGEDSTGLYVESGHIGFGGPSYAYVGRAQLYGVQVRVEGNGSNGIVAGYRGADAGRAGMGAELMLQDSQVQALQGDAVRFLDGDANRLEMVNSVAEGSDAALRMAVGHGQVRVNLHASKLLGGGAAAIVLEAPDTRVQLRAQAGSVLANERGALFDIGRFAAADVQLQGSLMRGGARVADVGRLDVALRERSVWQVDGNAMVDQLSVQRSEVSLANGHAGDRFVVRGDLLLDDGHLRLDTVLGGDAAASDRFDVQGDFLGNGTVSVVGVGDGAATDKGIPLITVGGQSLATLALSGRAVGGMYEYFLHRDNADGDWYLRSQLTAVDPCDDDPALPGCGVDPVPGPDPAPEPTPEPGPDPTPEVPSLPDPAGVLRPEAGAYLANRWVRQALLQPRQPLATNEGREGVRGWTRVESGQAQLPGLVDQLQQSAQWNSLQLGADLGVFDAGRGRAGVLLSSGRADAQSRSSLTGYAARGRVQSNALGVYAGWQGEAAYVDAAVVHARFRNRVQGDALAPEHYRSRARQASLQAGYRLPLGTLGGTVLTLQPDVQIVQFRDRGNLHVEATGTPIAHPTSTAWSRRLGLRLEGQGAGGQGAVVSPWLAAHGYRDTGRSELGFGNETIAGIAPRSRYEVGSGVRIQFRSGLSAWGGLNVSRGDHGYRQTSAQLGVARRW